MTENRRMTQERNLLLAGIIIIATAYFFGSIMDVGSVSDLSTAIISVGSVKLYPYDLATLVLGGVAASRFWRRRRIERCTMIFILFLVLSLAEFFRGLIENGVGAGVDFRHVAIFLAGIFFLVSIRPAFSRRDYLLVLGILIIPILVIYFGRSVGILSLRFFTQEWEMGSFKELRYIEADPAFVVFYAGMVCLSLASCGSRRNGSTYFLAAFGAMILSFATMQRSVWVSGTVALCVFVFLQFRFRLWGVRAVPIITGAFVLTSIGIVLAFSISTNLQAAVDEVFQPNSTVNWRWVSWLGLLNKMSVADWLLGSGFGADKTRWIGAVYSQNDAHNYYIATLWTDGLFGLALVTALYINVTFALLRIARRAESTEQRSLAVVLCAIVIGEMTFQMSYTSVFPTVFGLGCALMFVEHSAIRSTVLRPKTLGRAKRNLFLQRLSAHRSMFKHSSE